MPTLANAVLGAPVAGALLKRLAGVAPQRPAPEYAVETFRRWFARRSSRVAADAPQVLLWADTFTDNFAPHVGMAAVEAIEAAGYRVRLPERWLCCGRPLYDFGMLQQARRQLRHIVGTFAEETSAGTIVVGLEPSCVSTFRDELVNLFPKDADARRLADQFKTFAEFLVQVADHRPTPVGSRAIVHGHCHQKGTLGMSAEEELLDRLGLEWRELDAGCCGLAGSFGFEAGDKYDVSVAAGERKLLPAVRESDDDTIVIANGFSCRTQIDHLQDRRRAVHIAEVVAHGTERRDGSGPIEEGWPASPSAGLTRRTGLRIAGAVAVAASAGAALRRLRRTAMD